MNDLKWPKRTLVEKIVLRVQQKKFE